MKTLTVKSILVCLLLVVACSPSREDKSITWEEYEAISKGNESQMLLSRKDIFKSYLFGKLFKLSYCHFLSEEGKIIKIKNREELAKLANLQIDVNALLLLMHNEMFRFEFENEEQSIMDNNGCELTNKVCLYEDLKCTNLVTKNLVGEFFVPIGRVNSKDSLKFKPLMAFFTPGIIRVENENYKNPVVLINEEELYIFTSE